MVKNSVDTDTDKRLRTLSLFSGFGGIELGLKRWCHTVCYVELDSYAQATLCKNMAAGNLDVAPIWDDVTTFGPSELAQVEINAGGPIQAITCGFPCQDISVAGRRAGIRGKRSGLFFHAMRIIRLAKPRIIFLENVRGITKRALAVILGELADSGCNARWRMLSAVEMGAPHKRDRWWCLAYSTSEQCDARSQERRAYRQAKQSDYHPNRPGSSVADAQSDKGRLSNGNRTNDVADTNGKGFPQRTGKNERRRTIRKEREATSEGDWWAVEPDVGRVAHGIPFRVDRLKCLGNAVVPQCAEKVFELLIGG